MSQENVELVVGMIPPSGVDLAQLVRDDDLWDQLAAVIGPQFDSGFKCTGSLVSETVYRGGLDAFRAFWLDWLAPYATYYMEEIERTIDCGDQVVVVVRDLARLKEADHDIAGTNAGVWTIQDGRAVEWAGYSDPARALKAVGLEE